MCVCVCILMTNMSQALVLLFRVKGLDSMTPTAHANTNLTEPTVGGHDLLPLILKHTHRETVGEALQCLGRG